jgi:hypothetical protein
VLELSDESSLKDLINALSEKYGKLFKEKHTWKKMKFIIP